MTRSTKAAAKRKPSRTPPAPPMRRYGWPLVLAGLVAAVLVGLYAIYQSANPDTPAGGTPRSDYQIGSPGKGEAAPDFTLPSNQGGTVSLSAYRGKNVLLYFHEGLGCQPCWDQIRDLEKASAVLEAAGVDVLLTITTGPADAIAQKMTDDGLAAIALADTDLAVSRQYEANKYGMMGESRDGHSFMLVGPDGEIRWRADYGGAPKYTMYVPVKQLLADLEAGKGE